MSNLTRRQLAEYAAERLIAGDDAVVEHIAAYLVQTRRTREAQLVARDIEAALTRRGVVVAHVAAARRMEPTTQAAVSDLLKRSFNAKELHIDGTTHPELLSGIRISAADVEFDSTAQHVLNQLKALKI